MILISTAVMSLHSQSVLTVLLNQKMNPFIYAVFNMLKVLRRMKVKASAEKVDKLLHTDPPTEASALQKTT